jgi:hypothetical protein
MERRNGARRAADWRVLFGPAGELVPGFLTDVSPTGVCIVSQEAHGEGTEIEVHFGVHEDKTAGKLRMRAVVRHCAQGKIGAQFLDHDSDEWWKMMRGQL